MGTYNRHVKFGIKIPNHLGNSAKKPHGDFFDSHCTEVHAQSATFTFTTLVIPFSLRLTSISQIFFALMKLITIMYIQKLNTIVSQYKNRTKGPNMLVFTHVNKLVAGSCGQSFE